jgi:hypothetical protein
MPKSKTYRQSEVARLVGVTVQSVREREAAGKLPRNADKTYPASAVTAWRRERQQRARRVLRVGRV